MSDYESREQRLTGLTLRMRDVRSSLADCEESRKQQRAWLARNRGRLASWPDVLKLYGLLRPSSTPTAESRRFSRWARRQRWTNPALLKLRLECGWLAVRVAAMDARRHMSTVSGRDALLMVVLLMLVVGLVVIFLVL